MTYHSGIGGAPPYTEYQICESVIEPLAATENSVAHNRGLAHKILGVAIREFQPEYLELTEEAAAHALAERTRPKCGLILGLLIWLLWETFLFLLCLRLIRWIFSDPLARYDSIKAIQEA